MGSFSALYGMILYLEKSFCLFVNYEFFLRHDLNQAMSQVKADHLEPE